MANNTTSPFNWKEAINETYQDVSSNVVNFAPELIGAIALMLIGWAVAHILRLLTKKTISSFDSLLNKVTQDSHTHSQNERIKNSYIAIISKVVFWVVILFFVAASANLLGWQMFSGWMDGVIGFLPRIITGLLIVLSGFLLSSIVHSTILTAGSNAQLTQTASLARLAQVIILFSAVVIGVEQIGLHMQFLTTTLIVIVGVLLGGACLAFGLGANTLVANTIGAQYTRKHCQVGDSMNINGVEGEILEIRQTCIVLETPNGQAIIPAKLFHEHVSLLTSAEDIAVAQSTPLAEGEGSKA